MVAVSQRAVEAGPPPRGDAQHRGAALAGSYADERRRATLLRVERVALLALAPISAMVAISLLAFPDQHLKRMTAFLAEALLCIAVREVARRGWARRHALLVSVSYVIAILAVAAWSMTFSPRDLDVLVGAVAAAMMAAALVFPWGVGPQTGVSLSAAAGFLCLVPWAALDLERSIHVLVVLAIGILLSVAGAFLLDRQRRETFVEHEQARRRAHQQTAVAQLGQLALAGNDMATLFDEAVALAAAGLGVEHCSVLEHVPDRPAPVRRASVGWQPGTPEWTAVERDSASRAGDTLRTAPPVMVSDCRRERCFGTPPFSRDCGIQSGLEVAVPGPERPFGVLEARGAGRRCFTAEDVHFLEAIAHVLATAIERSRAEAALVATTEARAKQGLRLRRLHEVAADANASMDECIVDALRLGCEWLGMDVGAVNRVDGDVLTVEHAYSEGGNVKPGNSFDLAYTYPAITWDAGDLVSFATAAASAYRDHPAHRYMRLQCYVGIPLTVEGRPFGTLDFAAVAPGSADLDADDCDLVRLLALWVEAVITRKRAAEQLADSHTGALEAIRLKSEFLANMSHEIRTPMTGIMGMTELLLRGELTPQQREFLSIARSSAQELLALLNDLLDFSKIEAGRLVLETMPFTLRAHLQDALLSLAAQAHEKELELVCQVLPSVPDGLLGDPLRLRQVILNLVGNAIKFTEMGEIVVRVETESEGSDGVVLRVTISDTGIGVATARQRAIFEPFRQVDGSTTRRYGGTGLGLAISTQLVRMMGGRIWVESEEGRGSAFQFTARFGIDRKPQGLAHGADAEVLKDKRVLVVDDNATNRRIVAELLQEWQMTAIAVPDGVAALVALREAVADGVPFALVILDGHMPGMDGASVAARIRSDPRVRETPIVVLTSSDHGGYAGRFRDLGVTAYLTKPIVAPADLLRALTAALGNGEALAAPGSRNRAATPDRRLRILMADDNSVNRTVVAHLLQELGHDVVCVSDGRQAVDAYREHAFDVVLMDVQMSDMDGIEATQAIRERERTTGKHVSIVALTAHAMKGDRERFLEAGMDAYVSKPIQTAELLAAIDRSVPRQQRDGGARPVAAESDEDEFVTLDALADDPERLLSVATLLQDDSRRLLAEIRAGLDNGDAPEVKRAAHRLKGSLALLGTAAGRAAMAAAARVEICGHAGDLRGAQEALCSLEHDVVSVTAELRALTTPDGP